MTNIPLSDGNLILLFGALCSLLLSALVYIFAGVNRKVDKLGDKIEHMDVVNAKDHAAVLSRLSAIDTSLNYITRTVDDHEERISEIEEKERE